jgi:2-oxoisovalerate dehydrogenase E1 component
VAEPVDEHFTATISAMANRPRDETRLGSSLTVQDWLALFDAQLGSRHLDLAARCLRSLGKGYYTIGSAVH